MLENEKYIEHVLPLKTFAEEFFTGKQMKNTGQREMYMIKDNHKTIILGELLKKYLTKKK